MPSTLNGLLRKLTWNDYPSPRQGQAPGPGQNAAAAFTDTRWNGTGATFRHPAGGSDFELVDNITVSIGFTKDTSWRMAWAMSQPVPAPDDLLNHEQGHYTITALLARDYFIDLMLLKGQSFATEADGQAAVKTIKSATVDKIRAVQDLYDAEVHPEQAKGLTRGPIQLQWDGFFQSAFAQLRNSASFAPDGTPHRERLLDVLRTAGKKI